MVNPDRIIGIDPGLTGAIGFVSYDGKEARVFDTPRAAVRTSTNRGFDTAAMNQLLQDIARDHPGCQCAIELVHSQPGEGHVGAFSFGFGTALWHGMLAGAGILPVAPDPRRWQKDLAMEVCPDYRQRKTNSRLAAIKFFPRMAGQFQRVADHGRAEALLMAEWLRRKLVMAESMKFRAEDMDNLKKPPMFEDASRYSGKGGGILKLMDQMKKDRGL